VSDLRGSETSHFTCYVPELSFCCSGFTFEHKFEQTIFDSLCVHGRERRETERDRERKKDRFRAVWSLPVFMQNLWWLSSLWFVVSRFSMAFDVVDSSHSPVEEIACDGFHFASCETRAHEHEGGGVGQQKQTPDIYTYIYIYISGMLRVMSCHAGRLSCNQPSCRVMSCSRRNISYNVMSCNR
jgi:hypothetical protein